MKIAFISDLHLKHKEWFYCLEDISRNQIKEADLVCFCGDIYSYRSLYEDSLIDFINWLSDNFKQVVMIAGNHDLICEHDPEVVNRIIEQNGIENVIYLNNESCVINGIKIFGSPNTPVFHNWAFNNSENELKDLYDKVTDCDILITHGPPFSILDKTSSHEHVGSDSLLELVERIKPKIHAFGHIHEAYGRHIENGTTFINCSQVNQFYLPVNRPVIEKWT